MIQKTADVLKDSEIDDIPNISVVNAKITTNANNLFTLDYIMTSQEIENTLFYSIEIIKRIEDEIIERSSANEISSSYTEAIDIFHVLVRGIVTPTGLFDVMEFIFDNQ